MNIKRVTQALRLQESLTEDEAMMVNVLRALTPTERELLVGTLQPQKPVKKRTRGVSKSPRAASLASAIGGTGKPARCVYEIDDNGGLMPCGAPESDSIHDKDAGYAGYHEFQPVRVAAMGG
jgi:hypothetical protein